MAKPKETRAEKRKKPNYVDNKKLFEYMCVYRSSIDEWKKTVALCEGTDTEPPIKPAVDAYIAACIIKISTHLSFRPNFINYPFREDMIADGIENCIKYIDNFNPEKSKNPFAYFTQIVYFAFLRKIRKEKTQLYAKHKLTEQMNVLGEMSDAQEHDNGNQFSDGPKSSSYTDDYMAGFVETFEAGLAEKKRNKKRVIKHKDDDKK